MAYDLLCDSMEDFGLEWRCRAVFDGDFILPHDPNRRIANDVEIAVSAFYSKKTEPSMKVSKLIAWEFPSIGWFKFNTDGASKRNQDLHGAATGHSGKSGAGGLLRDCSGTWICGYTCKIAFSTSLQA